nr:unnamed protein product [Callosobruchus chinensis]
MIFKHFNDSLSLSLDNTDELVQKIMPVCDKIRADKDMIRRATSQVSMRATAYLIPTVANIRSVAGGTGGCDIPQRFLGFNSCVRHL